MAITQLSVLGLVLLRSLHPKTWFTPCRTLPQPLATAIAVLAAASAAHATTFAVARNSQIVAFAIDSYQDVTNTPGPLTQNISPSHIVRNACKIEIVNGAVYVMAGTTSQTNPSPAHRGFDFRKVMARTIQPNLPPQKLADSVDKAVLTRLQSIVLPPESIPHDEQRHPLLVMAIGGSFGGRTYLISRKYYVQRHGKALDLNVYGGVCAGDCQASVEITDTSEASTSAQIPMPSTGNPAADVRTYLDRQLARELPYYAPPVQAVQVDRYGLVTWTDRPSFCEAKAKRRR